MFIPLVSFLSAFHGCHPKRLHSEISKATDNVKRLKQLKLAFKQPIGEYILDMSLFEPGNLLIQVDGLTLKSANKQPEIPRNEQTVRQRIEAQFGIKLEYPHLQCIVSYAANEPDFIPLELLVVVTDEQYLHKTFP